nr:hypothetical protein [uncultured Clostridium sp.]
MEIIAAVMATIIAAVIAMVTITVTMIMVWSVQRKSEEHTGLALKRDAKILAAITTMMMIADNINYGGNPLFRTRHFCVLVPEISLSQRGIWNKPCWLSCNK